MARIPYLRLQRIQQFFAAPTTFTITYKSENGSLQTTNPSTYTYETGDITLAAPSREGSTFLGWTGTDLAGTTKNVTIKKGSLVIVFILLME